MHSNALEVLEGYIVYSPKKINSRPFISRILSIEITQKTLFYMLKIRVYKFRIGISQNPFLFVMCHKYSVLAELLESEAIGPVCVLVISQ